MYVRLTSIHVVSTLSRKDILIISMHSAYDYKIEWLFLSKTIFWLFFGGLKIVNLIKSNVWNDDIDKGLHFFVPRSDAFSSLFFWGGFS